MGLRQRCKKLAVLFLACSLMFTETSVFGHAIQADAKPKKQAAAKTVGQAQGVNVAYHSKEDIRKYVKANGATLTDPLEFAKEPKTSVPYDPGSLSGQTQQSALNMLKQMRYIAGLSDKVELSDDMCKQAQAAAFVNYVNNKLSHDPVKPENMDDTLYQLGKNGAGSSNIAWASRPERSLNETVALSWMEDGDASNIDRVGHRRWILNPKMGKTGFGAVSGSKGTYSSVYAFDRSNSSASETGVAWPAQNMPAEYFSAKFPWSISMGHTVNASQIKVTLTRLSDNQTWNFSNSPSGSDGDFYVNNGGYGQTGCIIFRPSGVHTYKDGDSYKVTITGDTQEISYTVNFFDLVTLEGISAEYKGQLVAEGGTVNQSDIVVTGIYSDGSKKKVTDFTIEPYTIQAGSNDITVRYGGKSAVVKVTGTASKITIQFDAAGGTAVSPRNVEKGSVLTEIPETGRKGYIFEGWYTAQAGGTKLEKTTVLDKNMTYYAHWKEIELSSISAETPMKRLIVGFDYNFEEEDFTVTAVYTDGSKKIVKDYTVDNYNLVEGENTLTVRYQGKTADVRIHAVSVVQIHALYIGVQKLEGTTELDEDDIRIYAKLSDGDTITVKESFAYTVDPFVIQPGDNTLTVHFGGTSADVEVIGYKQDTEVKLTGITASYTGGNVVAGNEIDKTQLVVKAAYSDGSTKAISDYVTAPYTIQAGENMLPITYQGMTAYVIIIGITPDEPVTPDKPDTPDEPVTPDKPDTPVIPDKPDIPVTPDKPDTPVTPDKPATPDEPITPSGNIVINFDAQGGDNIASISTAKYSKLSYIPVTYRTGWVFRGWYTGRNGTGSMLTLGTELWQDATYYAYWTAADRSVAGITVSVNGTAYVGISAYNILTVNAIYSDGTSERVYDYTVPQAVLQAGNNWIVVTWHGFSQSIQIQANANAPNTSLRGLTVTYSGGEVPVGIYTVFAGLTVKAAYSDGTEREVYDYTLSGNDIRQGSNTVTVYYEGKTADFFVRGYQNLAVRVHADGISDFWVAEGADLGVVLTGHDPVRNGYLFGGWYLDKDCTIQVGIGTQAQDGMHIYAKWQRLRNWKLNKSKVAIKQGKKVALSVKGLKNTQIAWTTSNKKVASVSAKGVVKAKKAGTAIITAVTPDGSVMTCTVKVRKKSKK